MEQARSIHLAAVATTAPGAVATAPAAVMATAPGAAVATEARALELALWKDAFRTYVFGHGHMVSCAVLRVGFRCLWEQADNRCSDLAHSFSLFGKDLLASFMKSRRTCFFFASMPADALLV